MVGSGGAFHHRRYRHDRERSLNTMDFTVAIQDEELARESAELLPTRETLDLININIAPVTAVNLAIAVNAATINSSAQAYAGQWITLATSG
jgi:hypothetical protein